MASVFDVAAFILAELGQMGTMKLQKLVYYSQAWSIVRDGRPLFLEKIEAWDRGPVVRELYYQHARLPFIERIDRGDPSRLSDEQRASIAAVLAFYGKRDEWWLSELCPPVGAVGHQSAATAPAAASAWVTKAPRRGSVSKRR